MAEASQAGGVYMGADGVLHDAHGKPIMAAPTEPVTEPLPSQTETLVAETERLAQQRAVKRNR